MLIKTKGKLLWNGNIEIEKYALNKLMKNTQEDAELFLEIETNIVSYQQLKSYWKMLFNFCENIPEKAMRKLYEIILSDLEKNGLLSKEILHELVKGILGITSYSFANMPTSQDRWKYYQDTRELLERWYHAISANTEYQLKFYPRGNMV